MENKIAVLVSGSECTTLQYLLKCSLLGVTIRRKLNADLSCVISNNSDSRSVSIARSQGIPHYLINKEDFKNTIEFSDEIFQICDHHKIKLIVFAGWLPKIDVAKRYLGKIINLHPSYLPKYGGKGMYGINVHRAVVENKEKTTGMSVHIVDNNYDSGKIIAQRRVPLKKNETPESLQEYIKQIEKPFYLATINSYLSELDDYVC